MSLELINIGTTANDDTGDNMRAAGIKINEAIAGINLLGVSTVNNLKTIIPTAAMLPLTANSAYWLNDDSFPAYVFSELSTEGVKIQLFDVANLIPVGATGLKIRLQAFHSAPVATAGDDVAWEVSAAWIAEGSEAVTFGTKVNVVQELFSTANKLKWSLQSADVTPSGTREASAELRLLIRRDIAYEVESVAVDTLDTPAKLYKVELEWTTD